MAFRRELKAKCEKALKKYPMPEKVEKVEKDEDYKPKAKAKPKAAARRSGGGGRGGGGDPGGAGGADDNSDYALNLRLRRKFLTRKATKAKKRLGKSVRLDVVRLIETADAGKPAPPSRVVIKLPRYDYDEIIDALEGEEDDAADSGGEDYELAG